MMTRFIYGVALGLIAVGIWGLAMVVAAILTCGNDTRTL